MLDMLGKEVRQKVIWDRIPLYCSDCRHVGHVRDSCCAFGKKSLPIKNDYTLASIPRRPPHTSQSSQQVWRPRTSDGSISTFNAFASLARNDEAEKGLDIVETTPPASPSRGNIDVDGFQRVGKRRGKHSNHTSPTRQGSGVEDVSIMMPIDDKRGGEDLRLSAKPASEWGLPPNWEEGSSLQSTT